MRPDRVARFVAQNGLIITLAEIDLQHRLSHHYVILPLSLMERGVGLRVAPSPPALAPAAACFSQ